MPRSRPPSQLPLLHSTNLLAQSCISQYPEQRNVAFISMKSPTRTLHMEKRSSKNLLLKRKVYVKVDVIQVTSSTPNVPSMMQMYLLDPCSATDKSVTRGTAELTGVQKKKERKKNTESFEVSPLQHNCCRFSNSWLIHHALSGRQASREVSLIFVTLSNKQTVIFLFIKWVFKCEISLNQDTEVKLNKTYWLNGDWNQVNSQIRVSQWHQMF